MSNATGYMILNPGNEATPLNFRGWLRKSLDLYAKEQGQPGVIALLFVTTSYVNGIGRKNLEKMLHTATQKHKRWLRMINLMTTPKALTDEETELFVEGLIANAPDQVDDLGDVYLGFATKNFADNPDEPPVCMIKQAKESDLLVLQEVHPHYVLGDWCVMGEIKGRQALSHPQKSLDEAYAYGRDFFMAQEFSLAN